MAQSNVYGGDGVDQPDPSGQPADDPYADKKSAVSQWYRTYLGREGGADEINGWAANPNFGSVQNSIMNSQEAKDYQTRQSQPATPTPKTGDFWGDLLGSGGQTPDDLTKFLTSSGWGDAGYKQGGKKGDMITDPSGHMWDAVFAAGLGGKGFQKIDPSQASNAGYSAAAGGGATAGGTGAAGSMGPMSDYIKQLLDRGFQTPSADDPAIRDQFAPVARTLDQGAQKTRQAAAERAAASGSLVGGEGGSFDASVNSINEDSANQKGQAMSSLIGKELQGRRDDVTNALQFAQGEEKMALQKELANIDAQLRSTQIGNQNQQFYDNLGFQIGNSANNDDTLQTLMTLLGR